MKFRRELLAEWLVKNRLLGVPFDRFNGSHLAAAAHVGVGGHSLDAYLASVKPVQNCE